MRRARRLAGAGLVMLGVLAGGSLAISAPALAAVPMVEGLSGMASSPFAARLEALVYPENETTTCEFAYGTSTAYGTDVACEQGATIEGEAQGVGVSLTGLDSGTTYDYKLTVKNASGKAESTGELTTPAAERPTVASETVAGLTSTDAQLEAKINPNFQETEYKFEYSTSKQAVETGTGTIVLAGAPPAAKLTAVSEEQLAGPVDLGNHLTPGTTYYYRVLATNNTGTTDGTPTVQSFTTLDLPVPTTGEATNVTGSEATFAGTIDPAGAETTYYVEYVSEAGYQQALAEGAAGPGGNPYKNGASTIDAAAPAAYETLPAAPLTVAALQPGTTYQYALVASNSVGSVTGPDRTFTTAAATPPLIETGGAVNVTSGAATLTGSVDTRGLPTSASFEFGTAPYSGAFQDTTQLAGSGSPSGLSFTFNGYLAAGTTYYYRVIATNADGTTTGVERSFTTTSFVDSSAVPATPLLTGLLAPETKPAGPSPVSQKALTKKQKLAKALKACHAKHGKQRTKCETIARRKYRSTAKKHK
jgi:hypothetical protein